MGLDYAAAKLPPYTLLDEPLLAFAPDDSGATDLHPLRGLLNFGPYTKSVFKPYTPALRVATVGPASGWQQRGNLMKALTVAHEPGDRREYVPRYPGFEKLFGVPLVAAPAAAHIKWPEVLSQLGSSSTPEGRLVESMSDALRRLSLIRDQFDLALVHLPDSWGPALRTQGFGHGAHFRQVQTFN